jgi:hypothetical protein
MKSDGKTFPERPSRPQLFALWKLVPLRPPPHDGGPWSFSLLHGFTGVPDAALPNAGLTFDKCSDLYGTSTEGGTGQPCQGGCGTVFEVEP